MLTKDVEKNKISTKLSSKIMFTLVVGSTANFSETNYTNYLKSEIDIYSSHQVLKKFKNNSLLLLDNIDKEPVLSHTILSAWEAYDTSFDTDRKIMRKNSLNMLLNESALDETNVYIQVLITDNQLISTENDFLNNSKNDNQNIYENEGIGIIKYDAEMKNLDFKTNFMLYDNTEAGINILIFPEKEKSLIVKEGIQEIGCYIIDDGEFNNQKNKDIKNIGILVKDINTIIDNDILLDEKVDESELFPNNYLKLASSEIIKPEILDATDSEVIPIFSIEREIDNNSNEIKENEAEIDFLLSDSLLVNKNFKWIF